MISALSIALFILLSLLLTSWSAFINFELNVDYKYNRQVFVPAGKALVIDQCKRSVCLQKSQSHFFIKAF